jgi:hypothetical protein
MEILFITILIIGVILFAYNYHRVRNDLANKIYNYEQLNKICNTYKDLLQEKKEELQESESNFQGRSILYSSCLEIIESRDLQINELKRSVENFNLIANGQQELLDKRKSRLIDFQSKINQLEKEKAIAMDETKQAIKLCRESIRTIYEMNLELEQLTKTAPIGNGN